MTRILVFAFLLYIGYLIVKRLGRYFFGLNQTRQSEDSGIIDADLIQDPECGAFFLKQRGVSSNIGGQTIYFCSEACQKKFIEQHGGNSKGE